MHKEALSKEALKLFPLLESFRDFYLAGGTALALQIGHRISEDFDFFSNQPIKSGLLNAGLLNAVEKKFRDKKISPLVNNADELSLKIDSIKITFLYYPFPLLFPLTVLEKINTAGVKEIAAMKAYTIGRRGSFKDYIDLYFILKEGHENMEKIISNTERKYKEAFNARLFLEQLVYFEDIQDTGIKFIKAAVSLPELKDFFAKKVKEIKL